MFVIRLCVIVVLTYFGCVKCGSGPDDDTDALNGRLYYLPAEQIRNYTAKLELVTVSYVNPESLDLFRLSEIKRPKILTHIARYLNKYPDVGLTTPAHLTVFEAGGIVRINDELLYTIVPYYARRSAIHQCSGPYDGAHDRYEHIVTRRYNLCHNVLLACEPYFEVIPTPRHQTTDLSVAYPHVQLTYNNRPLTMDRVKRQRLLYHIEHYLNTHPSVTMVHIVERYGIIHINEEAQYNIIPYAESPIHFQTCYNANSLSSTYNKETDDTDRMVYDLCTHKNLKCVTFTENTYGTLP